MKDTVTSEMILWRVLYVDESRSQVVQRKVLRVELKLTMDITNNHIT